jgi:hypothetical protein
MANENDVERLRKSLSQYKGFRISLAAVEGALAELGS